jgi:cell division septation protein DedD
VAKAEAAKADAARAAGAEAAKAEAARAAAAKAEAAKAEAARAAKADAAHTAAARAASAKGGGSKGWAVQLGVFGSRDNAERLAKQVKGSGFPVLLNEAPGRNGKKLYWVRVGPEPDQAGAIALSARLKAAGHRDARVVAYP